MKYGFLTNLDYYYNYYKYGSNIRRFKKLWSDSKAPNGGVL